MFNRKSIRVFLADRHPQFLDGFTRLFRFKPVEFTGQARTLDDLMDGLHIFRPDLLITAHRLQDAEASQFLPLVRERYPRVKILLFTMNCQKEVLTSHIQYLDGMLCKSAQRSDIWEAIVEITRRNAQFYRLDGNGHGGKNH
ncbi:MAG TPA: hypothetical protein VG870_04550 [Chitinophagaceae bacterium]|nr:hypothetical protein [Chitinophagaceae bacterium]